MVKIGEFKYMKIKNICLNTVIGVIVNKWGDNEYYLKLIKEWILEYVIL